MKWKEETRITGISIWYKESSVCSFLGSDFGSWTGFEFKGKIFLGIKCIFFVAWRGVTLLGSIRI
jgi:hypothetical protein